MNSSDSINIHERIQQMMKYKFKGKQKFPYSQNIPIIKLKKPKNKSSVPFRFVDSNRRNNNQNIQQQQIICTHRLSYDFNSQLLNKASQIIEQREYKRKNKRMSQSSPEHLKSQKRVIDALLSKFDEAEENILLQQSQRKLQSKLEIIEQRPKQDPKTIDLVKLPIIANAKNLNIMERKRLLHKWGENQFKYPRQEGDNFNDQITSFIKQVDKQMVQHENFKIKIHKQINRIEYLRDESFHHKYLGELLEMKSTYKFHDIFMRVRKVKNHLSIQSL